MMHSNTQSYSSPHHQPNSFGSERKSERKKHTPRGKKFDLKRNKALNEGCFRLVALARIAYQRAMIFIHSTHTHTPKPPHQLKVNQLTNRNSDVNRLLVCVAENSTYFLSFVHSFAFSLDLYRWVFFFSSQCYINICYDKNGHNR